MKKTPLLTAQNLTCIRQDRVLFEELCLSVYAGDIVQIQGQNGTGKTSLLRILAGVSRPFTGTIRTHLQAPTPHLLYIGHQNSIRPELTPRENLDFFHALHGLESESTSHSLESIGLSGHEDVPSHQLSAGQKKRTTLSRLETSAYPIWILDEPFTALDKTGVQELEQVFLQHVQRGGCLVFTTHQESSIQSYETYRTFTLQ